MSRFKKGIESSSTATAVKRELDNLSEPANGLLPASASGYFLRSKRARSEGYVRSAAMSRSKQKGIQSKTTAIKRGSGKFSELAANGLGPASASGHIHRSKSPKSKSNTCFNDLPDDVYAEILCRLPCSKHVVRCKCLSKRWQSLISFLAYDSKFTGRFISKTPIIRTLLDFQGNEFRVPKEDEVVTTIKRKAEELTTALIMEVEKLKTRMRTEADNEALITTAELASIMTATATQSLGAISNPLASLFKSIKSNYYHGIFVSATYNDLVLCKYGEYDYYICNPYTKHFVSLPPASPSYGVYTAAVGFISDLDKSGSRCVVVRPQKVEQNSSKLKVEIFSSETGVWRESDISFRRTIPPGAIGSFAHPGALGSFAHSFNGMLYWQTGKNMYIGFDPFLIDSRSSSSSAGRDTMDHYKGRIIEFGDKKLNSNIKCAGICGGRLRFVDELDSISHELRVWELEEEEDEGAVDRSGELILKCMSYSLDREMFLDAHLSLHNWRGPKFDPNDENIVYIHCDMAPYIYTHIFKCNIRTRKWSKVPCTTQIRGHSFQLTVRPSWPTPVPRIK